MKKGDLFEGIVDVIEFPNKGIVTVDGERIVVKMPFRVRKFKAC